MDRKTLNIILACAFLLFFSFLENSICSTDDLYKMGIEALKAKDTLRAEQLFKESIRQNSDAPSYFELAKINLSRNTFLSRNIAFENFQKAVWKDPNNIEYKYEYAKICKDFARFTAIDEYKEILKLDSTQVNAWINLGSIKEKEYSEFDKSVRNADGILMPLQEYADEDLREAEKYYKNALSIDSVNYDAILKLSLLYQKAEEPEKGISLLQRLVRNKKDDRDIHLSLGLLYYHSSKIKESFSEYKKAISLMDPDERKDFTINSVKLLLDPLFDDVMKKMSDDELEDFINLYWKVSEPLYLTDYNERLLEHYTRVAYSNLNFSVPKMGIVGWKSDRGEVILRYGEPLSRIRMRPQMGDNAVMVKTDVWNYKDFTLGFTDMASSGNYIFSAPAAEKDKLASQFTGDTNTYIADLRRNYYSYYEPKFDGPTIETPFNFSQLKSLDLRNHTDLLVSYALDAADSLRIADNFKIDHEAGVFFFDKDYEEKESKKERIEKFDAVNDVISASGKKLLVNTIDVPVLTDSGFVALEIRRTNDNGTSANRSKIKIKKFSNTRLDISDLILASRVELEKTSDHFVQRGNIFIQPNPTNQFDKTNRPYLYYEVYNLGTDAKGLTNFEQRISVSEFKEEKDFNVEDAFKSVLDLLGIGKNEEKISLTSNYQTAGKDSKIYLQLDLSKYPKGKYLIVVLIKDKISGREVETKSVVDWSN
ncbi:MAG: GWxTD domain-containing protein [Ignavibacteriales bacterium]|nr:GWxTD domain-containing protein [Ignavibacteriales bacterium]